CLGPVPFFENARKLPAEDVLSLAENRKGKWTENSGESSGILGESSVESGKSFSPLRIAVPRLARIANFDDLDPLNAEPGVSVTIVQPGDLIPRDTDLIILPGSKATRADMDFMRQQGWDIDVLAHARSGGAVLGICGGYQM